MPLLLERVLRLLRGLRADHHPAAVSLRVDVVRLLARHHHVRRAGGLAPAGAGGQVQGGLGPLLALAPGGQAGLLAQVPGLELLHLDRRLPVGLRRLALAAPPLAAPLRRLRSVGPLLRHL